MTSFLGDHSTTTKITGKIGKTGKRLYSSPSPPYIADTATDTAPQAAPVAAFGALRGGPGDKPGGQGKATRQGDRPSAGAKGAEAVAVNVNMRMLLLCSIRLRKFLGDTRSKSSETSFAKPTGECATYFVSFSVQRRIFLGEFDENI